MKLLAAPYPLMSATSLVLLSTLLGACGGSGSGGGGGSTPTPTVTNEPPTAQFVLDRNSGTAPLVITADSSSSSDSDGSVVTFEWDFDGEPGIGPIAQYTFPDAGTYTVTLTVTDDDGARATTSQTVTVAAAVGTSTLSGTVRILASTAADWDVNDRLTLGANNNDFDNAQPLPAPVTLGGFANVAGSGVNTGNLFSSGDPGDFFRVSLNGNEVIALTIADSAADLDLRLWDDQRNIVDASLGLTSTETITVADPGSYFIEVMPFSGASNYVLYVGQDTSASSMQRRQASRLSDPFVAGELIVKHQQQPSQNPTGLATLVRQSAEPTDIAAPALYQVSAQHDLRLPSGAQLNSAAKLRMRTLISRKLLQKQANVTYAELNLIRQAHAAPNDTFFGSQWHYPAINLPTAWDTSTGSENVIVAVVDSGVLLNHPDLDDNLVAGYDFISSPTRALDGDGIDADPNDPGDLEYGGSSSFHGTHVAGTVAAESNNASGVAGVAWRSKIMPMRALGKDGGSTFDIIQAVRYAAGLSNNSGELPAQPADVINLSLGSSFSSQSEQDTYNAVTQAGLIVVASAGNDGNDLPSYPAAYNGVIGVSATTITNNLANYSNFGSAIDVAAPGGSNTTDLNGDGIGDGVISTMGDDSSAGAVQFGYVGLSGTSMAAPHVAGVVALMKAVHPGLTPAEFNAALMAGELTDDLGDAGRDDSFGYGLINAQKAVVAAQQLASGTGVDPGPILSASASALNFGGFLENLSLTLQNIGTNTVDNLSVNANQPWVNIQPPGSSDGLGEYLISVDRSGLSDGAYQANLQIKSDAGDIDVLLIMQVTSISQTANAGLFYVILVDENGDTALPARLVNATLGEYPFTILNVPAGQYRLFAGTDADDDEKLCDAGEACGAYSTLDAPTFIAVNEDLDNLDFEAGFKVNLTRSTTTLKQGDDAAGIPFNKPSASNALDPRNDLDGRP